MEQVQSLSARAQAQHIQVGASHGDSDMGEMSLLPSRRHAATPRRLLERLSDGVVQIDASGAILYVNVIAAQLLGSPYGGLEGQLLRTVAPEAHVALQQARAGVQQARSTARGDETAPPPEIALPNGRRAQVTPFPDGDNTWWLLLTLTAPGETTRTRNPVAAAMTREPDRKAPRIARRLSRQGAASVGRQEPQATNARWRDARRETEAHLRPQAPRALFETLPVGMLYVRTDGLIMRANEAAARLLGAEIRRLEGSLLHSARWRAVTLEGERLAAAETPIAVAIRTGRPVVNEPIGIIIEGASEPYWVRMSAAPAPRSTGGAHAYVAVTLEDINDLRNAQRARDLLTRFSRAITRDLGEGVYALDADGCVAFLNPAAERLLGWSEGELLGRSMHEVIHAHGANGETRPANECALLRVLRTGEIVQADDDVFVRKDGSVFPVRFVSSPLREGDQVSGAVVAFNDITSQRESRAHLLQLQRSLETQANELATIIETMTEALVVCDNEGRIMRANAAARGLLGLSVGDEAPAESAWPTLVETLAQRAHARQVNGQPFAWDESPLSAVFSGATLSGGEDLDLKIMQANGTEARINITGAPLRDRSGQLIGAALTLRDVTMEREREIARVEFLNVLAHELRTPLTTVKAQTQLLHRRIQRGQSPAVPAVEQTLAGIARIERLVNDLLDATRLEAGTLELDHATVDMAALCHQIVEEMGQASHRDIEIIGADSQVNVRCDAARIARALSHILGNAIKFSPAEGRVTLRLSAAASAVTISVRDEGPGMTAKMLRHAFSRFYRAPGINVQQGSEVGLGLGLYLARGLVQAHNGTLRAHSVPGKGTLVWFTLPRGES